MILESTIRNLNPWWKSPSNIHHDKKIANWENSSIKYIPRLKYDIIYDFSPDNSVVYSLRGPRQVGKTTLVKLQIRDFLKQNIQPWNILYCTLDLVNTPQDIVDIIQIYLKISARQRKGRYYIFLDEISTVSEWQKGIKWLVDANMLKNCTILVTGSHSINIRNATERLPGRRGVVDNYDKILLPMKFSEYACMLNSDIKLMIETKLSHKSRNTILRNLFNKEIDPILDELNPYQVELNDILYEYMITGGTPDIVNKKIETSDINDSLYARCFEGIVGQWHMLKKNERLLKQLCDLIIKIQGNHTSWNALSNSASLGSSSTAANYAYTLQDLFVLTIIQMYGTEKKLPLLQKNKKFYFQDPFILHTFNGISSSRNNFEVSLDYIAEENNQGKIMEGIIADHLIRWVYASSTKKQTFDYCHHIFYWKDEKNREVDFVLYNDDLEVPIEVKQKNKIKYRELSGLTSFLNKTSTKTGLVLSKQDLDIRSDYVIIPSSLFLLLI